MPFLVEARLVILLANAKNFAGHITQTGFMVLLINFPHGRFRKDLQSSVQTKETDSKTTLEEGPTYFI